jgi:hypothetical protein
MTETATLTLTEFLLARIAEDEAVARDAGPQREWVVIEDHGGDYSKPLEYRIETKPYPHEFTARREPFGERVAVLDGAGSLNLEGAWASRHIVRHDPARVLAECEAKRQIVAMHPITDRIVGYGPRTHDFGCEVCHDWDGVTSGLGFCDTLRALALPYADHPDYDESWRP